MKPCHLVPYLDSFFVYFDFHPHCHCHLIQFGQLLCFLIIFMVVHFHFHNAFRHFFHSVKFSFNYFFIFIVGFFSGVNKPAVLQFLHDGHVSCSGIFSYLHIQSAHLVLCRFFSGKDDFPLPLAYFQNRYLLIVNVGDFGYLKQ